MLAGYGSDSDSEHTEEEAPNGRAAPLTTQGTHTAAAEGAAAPASTSSLLDGLPVPAASKVQCGGLAAGPLCSPAVCSQFAVLSVACCMGWLRAAAAPAVFWPAQAGSCTAEEGSGAVPRADQLWAATRQAGRGGGGCGQGCSSWKRVVCHWVCQAPPWGSPMELIASQPHMEPTASAGEESGRAHTVSRTGRSHHTRPPCSRPGSGGRAGRRA